MAVIYQIFLCLVVFHTASGALLCGNCPDVIIPNACSSNVSCGEDQLCGLSQIMTSTTNELRYRLRCMPKLLCTALASVPDGNLCARCCDTDLCNKEDCKKATTITTTQSMTRTTKLTTVQKPTTKLTPMSSSTPNAPTVPTMTSNIPTKSTSKVTALPTIKTHTVPRFTTTSTILTQKPIHTSTVQTMITKSPPPSAITSKNLIRLDRNNPSDQFLCTVYNSDQLNIFINGKNRIHLRRVAQTTLQYNVSVKEWQNGTVIRCEGVNTKTNQSSYKDVTVYVTGTKPYFPVKEIKEIIVKDGDRIGLTCIPEGDPIPAVTWTLPKTVHDNQSLQKHISYHYDKVELEISNMTSQFVGNYTCAAHNPLGTATFSYIVRYVSGTGLPVTKPPVPLLIKPDVFLDKQITITEGETTVVIPCTADGIPAPSILWTTSEELMPPNTLQYENYLLIHNVNFYDSRYYICVATNSAGTTKQAIHVLVKPKPHTMPSITLGSNLQVKYGNRVVLHCDVSGYPEPVVTWTFNGVDAGRSRDLVINRATMSNIGAYSCTAKNHLGAVTKTLVMLVTGTPPSIVTSQPTTITVDNNKPVIMKCQASGAPTPTITWMFKAFVGSTDSIQMTTSADNSTFTLSNVDKSGTVTCSAANPFGQVQASFSIISTLHLWGLSWMFLILANTYT